MGVKEARTQRTHARKIACADGRYTVESDDELTLKESTRARLGTSYSGKASLLLPYAGSSLVVEAALSGPSLVAVAGGFLQPTCADRPGFGSSVVWAVPFLL